MQRARLALVALLAGVVIGLSGTAAHAAITYSSWTSTGSWQGYSHTHRSWVDNGSKAGGLSVAVSPAAPAGWIGASGYLYRGTSICASATAVYSSATVSGLSRSASGNCGAGQYRGYGNAKAYTGTNYFSKNSPYSPYLSW
ncbi:hypothetical protein [Cellulomonas sp.]|uniref:hypothetical protein n=1 Tax=Cellulomonas sp. TaxID=40001 RepID=UPI002D731B2C|nr:hypothetical protein [Cellulomonas sp.]HYQ73886.1 hypothetical protein [Cellulomonas sp.]